jgi:CheY-like chemotaxis protein
MEPMSGFLLLQAIRAGDAGHYQNIPFIMINSDASLGNVLLAKKAGVTGYMVNILSLTYCTSYKFSI